jgi:hypothetical protein
MRSYARRWEWVSTGGGCNALRLDAQDKFMGITQKDCYILLTDDAEAPPEGESKATLGIYGPDAALICYFDVEVMVEYHHTGDYAYVHIQDFIYYEKQ